MNLHKLSNFALKLALYLLLFSFIVLNFLDFFNVFSLVSPYTGDVDFFKKLLSWALILYLFANLSLTKIITGFKNTLLDLVLLVGYFLVTFPSMIQFYLNNVDFELYNIFSFVINQQTSLFLSNYSTLILIAGLILIAIVSINIFLKLPIHKESFVGCFNLNQSSYFSELFKLLLILAFNYFFVFTFFRFFMEWFALAVDAALIVIGFIYYIYVYIFKHEKQLTIEAFLRDIINTGSTFFKQLVLYLQDKRTFFIAIALLITIHSVVDLGVYLIPFATGLDNGLYNILHDQNTPLKPLFALEGSWLHHQYEQLQLNPNLDSNAMLFSILILSIESLMYISNLGLYALLLLAPFVIFFSALQQRVLIPSKLIIIFTISMIILQLFLLFPSAVNNTIEFSVSTAQDMQGIVFKTQPFFEDIDILSIGELILIVFSSILLVSFISGVIYLKFEKYRQFWISLFYFIVLVFFLFYSTIFAQSYITTIYYQNIDNQFLTYNLQLDMNSEKYLEIKTFLEENNFQSQELETIRISDDSSFEMNISPRLYLVSMNSQNLDSNDFKNYDYLFFTMDLAQGSQRKFREEFRFSAMSTTINGIDLFIYNYSSLFQLESFPTRIEFILQFDDEVFSIDNLVEGDLGGIGQRLRLRSSTIQYFLDIKETSTQIQILGRISSIIVFIFISIFYIGGLVAYAIFYRRILEKLKQKLF